MTARAADDIDIREDDISALSPDLLSTLLKDHTLSTETEQVNISWLTDNYAGLGSGFGYSDQITIPCITGANGGVIVPRAVKSRQQQQQRSREMAEVFTPSWICNKQNNLIDSAWFGRDNVFNTEIDNPDGSHSWIVNTDTISFPEDKTWKDYVRDIQHNPKDTWENVPMQDFTEGSDIDWSRSVEEIDAQLYAKYGLTDEEIIFIESMIKPMS